MQNPTLFTRSCGDFPRLWAAETVSGFGSQVSGVALPLLAAVALGASPAQMGLLSAATTVPFLLIGLFAGVLVDRTRRRTLLVAADLLRAGLLAAIPFAWAAGWLGMELVYAVALGTGALTVIFEVAALSLLPAVVGREKLVEANGRLEASRSLAQIGGPEEGPAQRAGWWGSSGLRSQRWWTPPPT